MFGVNNCKKKNNVKRKFQVYLTVVGITFKPQSKADNSNLELRVWRTLWGEVENIFINHSYPMILENYEFQDRQRLTFTNKGIFTQNRGAIHTFTCIPNSTASHIYFSSARWRTQPLSSWYRIFRFVALFLSLQLSCYCLPPFWVIERWIVGLLLLSIPSPC